MSFLNQIFHSANLRLHIKTVFLRYPLPSSIAGIITIIFLILSHIDISILSENTLMRINASLILTFFISVGLSLFFEAEHTIKYKVLFIYGIPVVSIGAFYSGLVLHSGNLENLIFFILSLGGCISFLFFAPYLKKLPDQKQYYIYFSHISVVFFNTLVFGFLLFLLGNIAIASVIALFDLSFMDTLHADWSIISLSFFTPLFGLIQLPRKSFLIEPPFHINKFFSFLISYIAIPFIVFYFLILYVYSFKLLLNLGAWPKGEVSWLVIGFSFFGYLIYIFSYIREKKNRFIQIFRRYFPYIVLPQIGMLFYAIYLRIAQYDITTNRYFIVAYGIFLLLISLYFVLSKLKRLISIPILFTLFAIIISVGPWSAYSLPESRQFERLKQNLITAEILQGETIIPLENHSDIPQSLSRDIYSQMEYLCNYGNCQKIKDLFANFYNSHLEEKTLEELQTWEVVTILADMIGVKNYRFLGTKNNMLYLNVSYSDGIFPIDIAGYSKIFPLGGLYGNSDSFGRFDSKKKQIEILSGNKIIDTIDIKNIIETLYDTYEQKQTSTLNKQDLMFVIDEYKVIFQEIHIQNRKSAHQDDILLDLSGPGYVRGYILKK